jgi:hypothetical protein
LRLPGGFDIFAQQVVPILRKRGLFREDYAGTTLRDHYGLDRPANVFAGADRAIATSITCPDGQKARRISHL